MLEKIAQSAQEGGLICCASGLELGQREAHKGGNGMWSSNAKMPFALSEKKD